MIAHLHLVNPEGSHFWPLVLVMRQYANGPQAARDKTACSPAIVTKDVQLELRPAVDKVSLSTRPVWRGFAKSATRAASAAVSLRRSPALYAHVTEIEIL